MTKLSWLKKALIRKKKVAMRKKEVCHAEKDSARLSLYISLSLQISS
jgi:hypothetical protein